MKIKRVNFYTFVYANFMLSVLLILAYYGWKSYWMLADPETFRQGRMMAHRAGIGIIGIFILTLWMFLDRYKNHIGHGIAFTYAFVIIGFCLTARHFELKECSRAEYYVSFSHLAYAVTNLKKLLYGLSKKNLLE